MTTARSSQGTVRAQINLIGKNFDDIVQQAVEMCFTICPSAVSAYISYGTLTPYAATWGDGRRVATTWQTEVSYDFSVVRMEATVEKPTSE